MAPTTPRILTCEQVTQLLQTAQGHPLEAFVALALGTGMRPSEMLALQWSNVDFEQRCLQVRRAIFSTGVKPLVGSPKTKESQRQVMLIPVVWQVLLRHRETQEEKQSRTNDQWQNNDLVFCTTTGSYLPPKRLLDGFHRLLESAGLPWVRLHDLRLTAGVWISVMQGLGPQPLKADFPLDENAR